MEETRNGIILTRIAKKMRKETGNGRYRARVEDERTSLRTLIYISCTRPIRTLFLQFAVFGVPSFSTVDLMFKEPIVQSFSVSLCFLCKNKTKTIRYT